jgi:PAS domain S-box-containing protein
MFQAVFGHSPLGIALVSLEGRWLQVNPAVAHLLGYSATELYALDFQALTHPDDLERDLKEMRRTLAGEIDHYDMEKRYIRKDGCTVTALLTGRLVRDVSGEPRYFVAQLQDLSERDYARNEMERLRGALAHTERVNLVGLLTAALVHQLLQPVTAILSNAEAGQHLLQLSAPDIPAIREVMQDVEACGRAAAAVLEGTARLLRKEPPRFQRLDFNQLVGDTIEILRNKLALERVSYDTQLRATSAQIFGEPVQLQQVVMNLLLNAVDAMNARAPEERLLVVATVDRGPDVELVVSDRGIGVDPAGLQRMFDPFFTTKPDGMGMGLYVSAEIIRAHGGRLWAENNDGPGLTQHCVLPTSGRVD